MSALTIAGNSPRLLIMQVQNDTIKEPKFEFETLLPELKGIIVAQLDMPTRFSFAWTCRQYYKAEKEDFDCFAFADKCAELGYQTFLAYSIESGGPFDAETTRVAARHGRLEILAMKGKGSRAPLVQDWAQQAAFGGHEPILVWLDISRWHDAPLLNVASAAARGGHADLAIEIARESSIFSLRSRHGPGELRQEFLGLIQEAAQTGRLEPVSSLYPFARATLDSLLRDIPLETPDGRDRFHERFNDDYYGTIFDAGVRQGHVPLVAWVFKKDPSRFNGEVLKDIVSTAVTKGFGDLLAWAVANGGTVDLDAFPTTIGRGNLATIRIPPLQSLKFLHEKLGYAQSPFNVAFPIPDWATATSLQWLQERGYRFSFDGVLQSNSTKILIDMEVISWILKQGHKPNSRDILKAALHSRIDILDMLWREKTADLRADDTTIHHLLLSAFNSIGPKWTQKRFRFRPLLKTIKWLIDKGYRWDDDTSLYGKFVLLLLKNKPTFCKKYLQEIIDLNIPLFGPAKEYFDTFVKSCTSIQKGT